MTEPEIVVPRIPTSGQIVGTLVAKLGIKHSAIRDRNARRYYAADPEYLVKDSTKEDVFGAIAEVLSDSGLIPSPQANEGQLQASTSFGLNVAVARGKLGSVAVLPAPEGLRVCCPKICHLSGMPT